MNHNWLRITEMFTNLICQGNKSKTTLRFILLLSEWSIAINNGSTSGKDIGGGDQLFITGGNIHSTVIIKINVELRKLKINLTKYPPISLLDIYSNNSTSYYRESSSFMYIASLFTIVRYLKQAKFSSTDVYINGIWNLQKKGWS